MDQARQRQAGPAPERRGGNASSEARAAAAGVDASSGAAQAAAAAGSDASSAAAQAAAAQAICRTLRDSPALLDAVAHAVSDASSAAELMQLVAAGAESAPGDADTGTLLGALVSLCASQAGAARVAAAGLLPQVVRLLCSPDRRVAHTAAALCRGAAGADAAAKAALARERDAVPALLALLCGTAPSPPCCWEESGGVGGVTAPSLVAELLALLALPDSRAVAAAARTGGAVAGAGGSTVVAAVVAGGGVERVTALLRAALGGGGQGLDAWSAARLLGALNIFATTDPAAADAARAAGALPLAVNAVVAAQRSSPGPDTVTMLCEAVLGIGTLAAAGDLPALAARPDLVGALAATVALASGGASEHCSSFQAERLGSCASTFVAQLVSGGQGSSEAAAKRFLAAGGAANLVRRPSARVGFGRARAVGTGPATRRACVRRGHGAARFGWHTAAKADAPAPQPRPYPRNSPLLPPTSLPTIAQVRLLSSLGPCHPSCEHALVAICTLAALPSGRRALRAAGAEAAVRAAAAAAVPPTTRRTGDTRRGEAQRAGDIREKARATLQALMSPPGARLRASIVSLASTLVVATPMCWACGAAAPPGGGSLQKCTGCGGPERWCSKECQRASWVAGHREVCKARRAGGGC
jgi:hypothetical protein